MLAPSLFYVFYQEKAVDLRTAIMQVRVNRVLKVIYLNASNLYHFSSSFRDMNLLGAIK